MRFLFLLIILSSCSPLKSKLDLNREEFNLIKTDSVLINEINLSLKDSIDIKLIRRRLDSFFLKKYNKHELITSIELDRVFKGKRVEIGRGLNKDSLPNFDSMGEMKEYLKKVTDDFHKRKPKDSL